MALSKDQPRGRTGFALPITNFDLAATNIRWYSGEVVGQNSTGLALPLVPGLTPIGVCESSVDYSGLTPGAKPICVRSGQAIPLPQDGTIDVDAPIGTATYWDATNNRLTGTDGGGAHAYCGPLIVCRSDTSAEVSFDPAQLVTFGGDVMIAKTITHADLTAAALIQTIAIGVAPGRFIGGAKLLTTPFTGGGATSVLLDVGGTDPDGLIDADNVLSGSAGSEDFSPTGVLVTAGYMPDLSGQTINAIFTADVNVELLTAGSVTIRTFWKRVP